MNTLGGFTTLAGTDYPTHSNAGAPTNGVDEVQRLVGTATSGQLKLTFVNPLSGVSQQTANIAFDATAAAVQAALLALSNMPTNGVAGSGGPLGGGNLDLTFQNDLSGLDIAQLTVQNGTVPLAGGTVTPSTVTAGVPGTKRGASKGDLLRDVDTPNLYQNAGTPQKPNWELVGTQS